MEKMKTDGFSEGEKLIWEDLQNRLNPEQFRQRMLEAHHREEIQRLQQQRQDEHLLQKERLLKVFERGDQLLNERALQAQREKEEAEQMLRDSGNVFLLNRYLKKGLGGISGQQAQAPDNVLEDLVVQEPAEIPQLKFRGLEDIRPQQEGEQDLRPRRNQIQGTGEILHSFDVYHFDERTNSVRIGTFRFRYFRNENLLCMEQIFAGDVIQTTTVTGIDSELPPELRHVEQAKGLRGSGCKKRPYEPLYVCGNRPKVLLLDNRQLYEITLLARQTGVSVRW